MKQLQDILFVVQARTNSERVPSKMTRPIGDTCLFEIFIEKIKRTKIPLEQFRASVYDQELIDICNKHDIQIYQRSQASRDEERELTVMYEWWDKFPERTHAVLFNPCLIFLDPKTIDDFVDTYLASPFDGMFGAIEKQQYFWNSRGELITPWPEGTTFMNTKLVEHTLEAAHGLYAGRLDLIGQNTWMGKFEQNDPVLYPMQEFECLDIDYEWQFEIYTHYWRQQNGL